MVYLSVVIPLYDESSLVKELIEQTKIQIKSLSEDFEIILVDDGSQDKTWELIEFEAKLENRIKGIKLSKNFGHHYAITAGLHSTNGEWIVVMDGDLQDRPEVIPELYKKAKEGFDVVFVSRKNRNEKLYYRLGQKIFYWALRNLSGIRFDSQQANFSIINKKVVEAFRNFPENARFYGTTIKWLGFKSSFIVADQGVRHSGKPSYTIKKRISLASDVILSFSNRPLKIAIGIGVLMSVISISLVFLIIYGKLMWNFSVIGWPSIMASIFFTGGNILIVLGIVGIYIGKIFEEVKSRPLYVIAERCNL